MNTIEAAIAERHFDSQIELVGEHWVSVQHLFLSDPDVPAARELRSSLPPEFDVGCDMPGLAKIRPTRGGLFEFASEGRQALIIPCYDCIAGMLDANAERHVEELRDLVAVDLDHPDHFWRRRGEAVVLGTAFLEIACQECEPVSVYRNPMTWLRAGAAGIVVLDWNYARDLLLDLELVAQDVELGNRLAAALKPEIWVMEAA